MNKKLVDRYFTGTSARIEGVGLEVVAEEARRKHEHAFRPVTESLETVDPVVHLLLSHPAVEPPYNSTIGVSYHALHADFDAALSKIVDRFGGLTARYAAVVVVGGVVGGVPGGSFGGVLGGVIGGALSSAPPPPPPPKPQAPKRIRVGGQVESAKVVFGPHPEYPPLAKMARIQGTVRLDAVISRDGTIQNLKIISGHPLLVKAALEAVERWRYQPTMLNGDAVEVATEIDVNFTLQE